MRNYGRWWEKRWYWILCSLLAFIAAPILDHFFFPERPLTRSLVYATACSIGVLLAYYAYTGKPIFGIRPKNLRRIITIMGGAFFIGFLLWAFIVIPLASYLHIPGSITLLLLFVLMVVCAFILDTLGKRRDYEPLISGKGNI